jgi:hypothetical protein
MYRSLRMLAVPVLSLLCAGTLAAQPANRTSPPPPARITSPSDHIGRPLGGDFTLTDWQETSTYFKRLDAESPRVITRPVGTTTEGREFLISIISSEANLAALDRIQAAARRIADPRGASDDQLAAAVADARPIVMISCAMHATECAGAQFGMDFAYRLASSDDEPWASARERLIVVMIPSTNPDGQDHVTNWYRQTVGTPREASDLLKLYQYYTGHDNNRDWFMMTQAETRIITRLLYSEWFPTIYWDVHQQGTTGERMFVPPFRDPLNPNLDPAIVAGINTVGSRAVLDLTREGLTGISTGVSYDMWWNGGNRNVPVRHNIIGLLTEAASCNLATPIFLPFDRLQPPRGLGVYAPSNQLVDPWPGGWWRIRDIIDYELAFGRSLLASLVREPRTWLTNSLEASRRAIAVGEGDSPKAWIIPSDNRDPHAVRRLMDAVMLAGVEVHVSESEVSGDGRVYAAGSIVIRRDQPYGTHVKDLFEVQRYPEGQPPYDVAGWTLPTLMGVRRVEVVHELKLESARLAATPDEAAAAFKGDPRATAGVLSAQHTDAWTRLAAELGAGRQFTFHTDPAKRGLIEAGGPAEVPNLRINSLPRIGLYAPWSGSMDEGWTRFVLDSEKIPYTTVRNETLRAGRLADVLDVLIIPGIGAAQLDRGRQEGSTADVYTGGLAPEGAVAIEEFVRTGGCLIAFGSSARWAIELFELPLIDVTSEESNKEFSCPGSVLRTIPTDHAFTAGLPESVAVFFARAGAFREMTADERKKAQDAGASGENRPIEPLLRYAPTRLLLSGWIKQPEAIENRYAWARVSHGKGRVHLFGFQPQYRGWSQGTFQLLYRAAFFDGQR